VDRISLTKLVFVDRAQFASIRRKRKFCEEGICNAEKKIRILREEISLQFQENGADGAYRMLPYFQGGLLPGP